MVVEPRGLWAEKSCVAVLVIFVNFIVFDLQIEGMNIIFGPTMVSELCENFDLC